ncbi:hypothetical protein EJ110_NYTH33755 [Nymphaea thermarum]|nr:hypothetical protein EJ110_NYTH33755 [Nymphaea thermarum]
MAVVGLDTRFHYVLAGWEGSATNSRVLYGALDHEIDPFVVPEGKYYLADGGYPNIQGLLTPYRGHRYHMSEFSTRGARSPRTSEELFNHRHSSLRNTVERTFGMLKGRFPILKMQVQYPFQKQAQIVLATCVLHNFIIEHNPNAQQFEDEDAPSNDNSVVSEPEFASQTHQRGSNNALRAAISSQMFTNYQLNSKTTKMMPRQKYYVVFEGRERCIYDSWERCQPLVYRYKGAVKSFDSLEVAENHMYEYLQKKYGVQVSRPPLIEDVTAKQDIEDTKFEERKCSRKCWITCFVITCFFCWICTH